MALIVKDRVLETTTSTGTGTITLGGAVSGYQSFSVIGNGNTTYYSIVGDNEWEVGIGTYTASGTTLSRDTVLESSNSGSLVNFSAGTKQVFVTYPAEKSVDIDSAQTLTNKTISGASNTLSNIGNSSLTNSSITINGTPVSLGGSASVGTVTSVSGTSPITSSGGNTPAISLSSGYGDTQNPYASKTANFFLAAPNGAAGAPTFRAIVAADVPTLNQNTTGTASNVTGTVAIGNGGTNATTAAAARTNLGASTVGSNFFTLTNPSAITFVRINADNTVSALDAATFRTAIGATSTGTVTSVAAGNGMSFTTITGTGTVTMGTPSSISNSSTNSVSAGTHTHALSGELVETTSGSPLYYGARAWVKFSPVSGTPTVDGQVNVSSLTDNGVGVTTVNFTTAMPDANYAVSGFVQVGSTTVYDKTFAAASGDTWSTSGVTVRTASGTANWSDGVTSVVIFR